MIEYKICQGSKGQVEKEINRLAKEGWELFKYSTSSIGDPNRTLPLHSVVMRRECKN